MNINPVMNMRSVQHILGAGHRELALGFVSERLLFLFGPQKEGGLKPATLDR